MSQSIKNSITAVVSVAVVALLGLFVANPSYSAIHLSNPSYKSAPCASKDMKSARNFVVYGKLTDSSNKPRSGVNVVVRYDSAKGKQVARTTTGANGVYKISVKARGLKSAKLANFVVVVSANGKSANKKISIGCQKAVKVAGKISVQFILAWLPISTY